MVSLKSWRILKMIHRSKKFTFTDTEYPVIQYYGESCLNLPLGIREEIRNDVKKYIGKKCTTLNGYEGIIIGFEDNSYYRDYYYIIFVPETKEIVYALANNAGFIETIK